MNNLHRKLAPISKAAWAEIEEEASRTLKRYLAARHVVDVEGPKGFDHSATGTGHIHEIEAPADGVRASLREVKPLVELRVPFELSRQAVDDVERGSTDSDWSPIIEAAHTIAFAEDRSIFEGYAAAGIQGLREGSTHPALTIPPSVHNYPDIVAQAVTRLRESGINGPYALVLGAAAYTAASGGSDEGYPVLHHIQQLVDAEMVWAPAIEGGFVVSTRGGDFELNIGQDFSIGYLSHSEQSIKLYLQESFTFRLLTPEAVVPLAFATK